MKSEYFQAPAEGDFPTNLEAVCFDLVKGVPQEDYSEYLGGDFLGSGEHSDVYRVEDYVVKVSSPSTGQSTKREDLLRQGQFMHGFGQFLEAEEITDIAVPNQYFAAKSGDTSLSVQEYMDDWVTMRDKYGQQPINEQIDACLDTKQRIRNVADRLPHLMRFGLDDLEGQAHKLRMSNVLVRPELDLPPSQEPICIIDQSGGRGPKGWLAAKAAQKLN